MRNIKAGRRSSRSFAASGAGAARCVGCESKSADRRPTDQNVRNERRGNLRGRVTRGGAAAAIERSAVRSMVHGAVRDGVSSGVRTGAVHSAAGREGRKNGPRRRVATRPARSFDSGGDALDRDTELARLVDQIVGDARTRERDDALGEEIEQLVIAPEGRRASVCVPVGLADDLVDAVAVRPLGRDLLDAGATAVDQDHVVVLGLEFLEGADDGACVAGVLAACHRHERSLGQERLVLAVPAGTLEVSGVDHGRSELAGLGGVGPAPGPPEVSGLDPVGLGRCISELLEGVPPVREVLGSVGDEFELSGPDLRAVLLSLEVAHVGEEPIGRAVEALGLGVEHVDEAPEQALALVGELRSVGRDAVCHDAEGFRDGGEGVLRVPDLPVVEFVALRGCAEESRLVADGGGDGLVLF